MEGAEASWPLKVNGDTQTVAVKGEVAYKWKQSIDEVNIFLPPAFGCSAKELDVRISPKRLYIGGKAKGCLFEGELFSTVDTNNSFWMIEDNELHIQMCKMRKGEIWQCCIIGHGELDPFAKQQIQKNIMLERFQEENPGFDFSSAQFSGEAPDPRKFMGGISYK